MLTSANGASRLLDALHDARDLGGVRVAAIGPGTAGVLARGGIVADLVPERYVAESLLDAFPAPPPEGGRVLLARAAVARDVLPDGLRARGWTVDVVEAYRTRPAPATPELLGASAAADAITFTSSSTVEHYLEAAGRAGVPPVVACIGPVTAATARSLGLDVTVEADVHTVDGPGSPPSSPPSGRPMRRSWLALALAAVLLAACHSSSRAGAPTTTTTTTGPPRPTTSTTSTTLGKTSDPAFHTRKAGVLTVATDHLEAPYFVVDPATGDVTSGYEYDIARVLASPASAWAASASCGRASTRSRGTTTAAVMCSSAGCR